MKKLIAILFVLICLLDTQAKLNISVQGIFSGQSSVLDSVDNLNDISKTFLFTNPDSAFYYLNHAKKLADEYDYAEGKAMACHNAGIIYYLSGEYMKAIEEYNKALEIREVRNLRKDEANTLSNLALIYNKLGNYETAIEKHFKALTIRELIKDTLGVSKSFNNLGEVFYHYQKLEVALHFYRKSLAIKRKIGDKKQISSTLNNIGLVYFDVYQESNDKIYVDSCEANYKEAIQIRMELKDTYGISETKLNLANLYAKIKDYATALKEYTDVYELQKSIGNKNGMALTLFNKGVVFNNTADYEKSIQVYLHALEIAGETKQNAIVKDVCLGLSKVYLRINDFETAYSYHERYAKLKDSLYNINSSKAIAEIQSKYEVVTNQNKVLEKENEIKQLLIAQKNSIIIFSLIILAILLFSIVLLFKAYRKKRRLSNDLRIQKNELKDSREIILDSIKYAQTIQKVLLPSIDQFVSNKKNSFVIFKPKDIVSGDFLWYRDIGNKKLMVVTDCTGHGVPGAFISIVANNLLNEIIVEKKITDPEKILFELDSLMKIRMAKRVISNNIMEGMDIAICLVESNAVTYSGARMPVLAIRNGKQELIRGLIHAVGEFPDKINIVSQKINFKKGEMLYMFSDGYQDQFGEVKCEPLRINRMLPLFEKVSSLEIKKQKKYLEDYLMEWQGQLIQTDDILVLGMKF